MKRNQFLILVALAILTSISTSKPLSAQTEKGIGDFPKLDAKTDWPWWRGPTRDGKSDSQAVPTEFGEEKNLLWKTAVSGRGHSSPIIVGTQVYLATADESAQTHSVVAFNSQTGEQQWSTQINQGGFPARNHPKNTEASPTIASDGERLFITFYHHDSVGLTALKLDGNIDWQINAGHFRPQKYEYGYAPSPLLYRNSVIIAAEYDGESFLAAFNRSNGKELWRTKRPANISFSSPVVTKIAGKDQLLISGAEHIAAYNPANGKELWNLPGTTHATCGTMVWEGNLVFASGGYPKPETIAIDASTKKVLWTNGQKCYEQSMIVVDGYLYGLTDNGVMYCWRAKDGKEMWKERLEGPVSASPIYAGGHIFWANELGSLYVFKPNSEKFELVSENHIGDSSFASPAVSDGKIFIRAATDESGNRQEYLYCFGVK